MIISDVTQEYLAEYLKLGELSELSSEEAMFLSACETAAKSYIIAYTSIPDEELDNYEDITIAYLVLIADMYDNRSAYVDKSNPNRTVETILDFHRLNLL